MLSSEGSRSHAGTPTGVKPGELHVVVAGAGPAYEVRLLGELDMSTASKLREELVDLTAEGPAQVTVDLSELVFVDSTGLSVLIIGLKRLRQKGGDMALRSPTPATRRVLEITGLTEVFSIS